MISCETARSGRLCGRKGFLCLPSSKLFVQFWQLLLLKCKLQLTEEQVLLESVREVTDSLISHFVWGGGFVYKWKRLTLIPKNLPKVLAVRTQGTNLSLCAVAELQKLVFSFLFSNIVYPTQLDKWIKRGTLQLQVCFIIISINICFPFFLFSRHNWRMIKESWDSSVDEWSLYWDDQRTCDSAAVLKEERSNSLFSN